ncbi:MAG: AI-2E family transporter [Patescibacteria group bacterium]
MNTQTTIIKIDPWSVIKILSILIILAFLYLIRDIILIFLGAVILSFIFLPVVDALEKKGISRFLGTFLVYLAILLILIGIIIPLIPAFIREFNFLIEKVPAYYEFIRQYIGGLDPGWSKILQNLLNKWSSKIDLSGFEIFSVFGAIFGWIFILSTLLIIAFYLTVQKEVLKQTLTALTPEKYKENIARLIELIQKDIGAWGRGLLILCLVVGLMDYIGLKILGINFALTLAILGGVFEVVPWLGPWLAGIFAVVVALTQSPVKALMVAILYIAVQQIENNLIVPQVMKRAVGLNPLLVILILLIGAKLAGPAGIILAVPVVTVIIILVKEYFKVVKFSSKS